MPMAATSGAWTLEMLHALPDDGNKYELVRGALFVTPAPSNDHETILGRLTRILDPYAARYNLGYVYHPHAIMRFEGSEVEPDLMVRAAMPRGASWDDAPAPILVVEVASPSTNRRDRREKRSLYLDAGVPEYWVVDGDSRTITVVCPARADAVVTDVVRWHPAGASEGLDVRLSEVFDDA